MEKATAPAPAGSRITPSSQEIRLRNTPTNSRGDPTRECEKQHAPSAPVLGIDLTPREFINQSTDKSDGAVLQ